MTKKTNKILKLTEDELIVLDSKLNSLEDKLPADYLIVNGRLLREKINKIIKQMKDNLKE